MVCPRGLPRRTEPGEDRHSVERGTEKRRALEKNHLVSPSGERYGRLYFLSQEMEAHLPIFDEIWVKIQPRAREVKK